ncbi:hypothetical protein AR438_03730 [Chryseobacterium aquaticum]|uniref:Uncharacterized protein n=1 Tax=Chryseobacterium aquaticum TaxID=452084 RepID=A0A0Q3HWT8_9FLAO|nr:hypothetical protein [Chryseobacterium aquaticum]KQK27327.1 hypothetical protein AR438_03730 [Chryseobacterium aquaticum]
MKKILILIASISSMMMFSQEVVLSRFDLLGGTFSNSVNSSTGKSIKYDEISGSPYIDKNFRDAKIAESYQNTPIRYNSYKDELEFKNNDEIMILPKESKFERVEIISPKQVFVYKSLEGEPPGYYIELVGGKFSLYKKLKTNFVDVSPATTPYGSDKPAYFSTVTPVYYIVANGQAIKKPKNQKQIIDLLPDKKEALSSFFKENKIKLDKEEDLKKIVTFLNQN